MGSSSSRFKEAVRRGDRREAYELFYRSRALQSGVDWDEWLGRDQEGTLLHYTAKHGMRSLYVALLERGGLPEQKASHRPSSLICFTLSSFSRTSLDRTAFT